MALSRSLRATFASLLAGILLGCGGIGDVASPSGAQAGSGGNSRPSIAGQPTNVVAVGQTYSFQPAASDGDGDSLTFTATNLPSWITLNSTSGRLTGTPQAADIATYSGITITASDGKSNTSFGPFSITVTAMGSGTATLSWTPPTQNTDGSALTDLAGYVVIYGDSPSDLSRSISIDNPSVTTYMVENLTSGTWHFAILAVNARGTRSPDSSVATKTIS